jgi:hypothetical protein
MGGQMVADLRTVPELIAHVGPGVAGWGGVHLADLGRAAAPACMHLQNPIASRLQRVLVLRDLCSAEQCTLRYPVIGVKPFEIVLLLQQSTFARKNCLAQWICLHAEEWEAS